MEAAMNLLASHPALVGFESPGRMLVTAVKEVFENAVDACRLSSMATIKVTLRPARRMSAESTNGLEDSFGATSIMVPLELIVKDSGCGMSMDPEMLVQLFASTKALLFKASAPETTPPPDGHSILGDAPGKETSGQFGVGLTASILHCSMFLSGDNEEESAGIFSGGGVCQITTRLQQREARDDDDDAAHPARGSRVVRCVFGVDRSIGRVVCLNREHHDDDNDFGDSGKGDGLGAEMSLLAGFAGTEVRLVVPGGSVVGSAGLRLRRYFQRLHLTTHLLHCSVEYLEHECLEGANFVVPYRAPPPPAPPDQLDTARRQPQLLPEGARRYLHARWPLPRGADEGEERSVCFAASTRLVDECRADVAIFFSPVAAMSKQSAAGSSGSIGHLSMEVVRMANHVPLPDSAAAVACGACSALASQLVSREVEASLGLRLRGVPHFDSSPSLGPVGGAGPDSTALWLDLVDLAAPLPPAASLTDDDTPGADTSGPRPWRPGCPGGLGAATGQLSGLTVVVDLQGLSLNFGSLDKAYLANQSEYREATTAAFVDCVRQLRASNPTLFVVEAVDPKQRVLEELVRVEVPAFADALAALIAEIDEDGTRQCLDLLALPPTHMHQPTLAAALCEKVAAIVISTHDDSSEWTTKGKRRKLVRRAGDVGPNGEAKLPNVDASKKKAAKRRRRPAVPAEGDNVDEGDDTVNDEYSEFSKEDLKGMMRSLGLKVAGTKLELLARVREFDATNGKPHADPMVNENPADGAPDIHDRGRHHRSRSKDSDDRSLPDDAEVLADDDAASDASGDERGEWALPAPYERIVFSDDESDGGDKGKYEGATMGEVSKPTSPDRFASSERVLSSPSTSYFCHHGNHSVYGDWS